MQELSFVCVPSPETSSSRDRCAARPLAARLELTPSALSGLYSAPSSCQGRCREAFDKHHVCHCNDRCQEFGNCCEDFESLCGDHGQSASFAWSQRQGTLDLWLSKCGPWTSLTLAWSENVRSTNSRASPRSCWSGTVFERTLQVILVPSSSWEPSQKRGAVWTCSGHS